MEKFYYPVLPNFVGLKLDLYAEIFFTLLGLGICVGLLIFFLIKHNRRRFLDKTIKDIRNQTRNLDKITFQQKLIESDKKQQVSLFIEYLNKFYKLKPSSDFKGLMLSVGISEGDSDKISKFLYNGKYDPDIQGIIAEFLKK